MKRFHYYKTFKPSHQALLQEMFRRSMDIWFVVTHNEGNLTTEEILKYREFDEE